MSAVKERPILFSGPMVRAILDGRKTQTRRIVKFKQFGSSDTPGYDWHFRGTRRGGKGHLWQELRNDQLLDLCPYGKPGDRLWVREACRVFSCTSGENAWYSLDYAAGGGSGVVPGEMPGEWFPKISHNRDGSLRWQPSIHMPRWASRLTLEVTEVRVERLQDISENDAFAEGVSLLDSEIETYYSGFKWLWQSINCPDSWDANLWVWVVSFKRIDGHYPSARLTK